MPDLLGSRRVVWRVAAIPGLLLVAVLAGLGASVARAVTTCAVTNTTQATSYTDLGVAISSANPSDTLNVRGRCIGNFVIDRNLTLKGRPKPAHDTLDGNNSGSVVTVNIGVIATITNLVITHGNAPDGGGILNHGRLTLNGSARVNYNSALYGGGIENWATLTMTGAAQAEHNTSYYEGGGIESFASVTLMGHAHLNYNTSGTWAGGIAINDDGTGLTLTLAGHAQVDGNTAVYGGGIRDDASAVILKGSAQVIKNTSAGGSIPIDGGFLLGGTLTACQTWTGKISPNTPDLPPTPTIDTTC